MKARLFTVLTLAVALALMMPGGLRPLSAEPQSASVAPATTLDSDRVVAGLHNAPMLFVENAGQFDARARFQVREGNGTVWLTEDGLWITVLEHQRAPALQQQARSLADPAAAGDTDQLVRGVNLKLSFVGANPQPRLVPFSRLATHVSYFVGKDPAKWHADVPAWGGVRYVDLYPGVDLELSGAEGRWQPRLVVRSGANLSAVRLRVEGAETLSLHDDHLQVTTSFGAYTWPLFQLVSADGRAVSALDEKPDLKANEVTAPFASGDGPLSLGAAPTDLVYSTFLGGSTDDYGLGVKVDATGAAYVTGYTSSTDFPTTPGAFQTVLAGGIYDAFVTKLNTAGNALEHSTFLGGTGVDTAEGITVDASGAAFVVGRTSSSDFPVTAGALQTTYRGGPYDGFVTKLSADGSALVYSTLFGGVVSDGVMAGVAVDALGDAFVAGYTNSIDFPTTAGAFQTVYAGGTCGVPPNNYPCPDAFVAEVNPDGSSLVYSTYLGGSVEDYAQGIAVDASGAAYVTGSTSSSTFPSTSGAFDPTYNGGLDAFVTKFTTDGSGLVYSTFLGSSSNEGGYNIAVDASGAAYVSGLTQSLDFPTTVGAVQTTYGGGTFDAFLTKLSTDGSGLVYSTFLGGSGTDGSYAVAVDATYAASVTGFTSSTDFPTTPGAFQESCGGCPTVTDGFVTQLDASGTRLLYSTFLGGSSGDYGRGLALDAAGSAYVTGWTYSTDFPITLGSFQTTYGGGISDGFVTKLVLVTTPYRLYLPVILYSP